jgi:hypothetical protein
MNTTSQKTATKSGQIGKEALCSYVGAHIVRPYFLRCHISERYGFFSQGKYNLIMTKIMKGGIKNEKILLFK